MTRTGKLYLVIIALLTALVLVTGLFVADRASNYQPAETQHAAQHAGDAHYEWRMVTTWPKNFPALGVAPENFVRLVERMSNGRLRIKVFGAGELVPALGVFDAVSSGSVEMGHSAAYYWKGKIPSSPLFTSVPFGLNVQEMNGWLHYGGGLEMWRELYAPFNLVPFAGGNTGVQMAGWFNKEINTVEDLKGLKMRIPGIAGEVFTRAGGVAVTIAGGDLYTSMETGVIDATEWVGPYNDVAFGLHEVAEYYYYTGWHEPGPVLEFTVNKDKWDALPADLQAIIESAARTINQDMLDEYTARNATALQDLKERYGITPQPFPPEVVVYLKEKANEYYQELSEQDEDFRRIYASYSTFAEQVGEYQKISEYEYFKTRSYE